MIMTNIDNSNIFNLFRQNGWTEEVQFDDFVDAYQW